MTGPLTTTTTLVTADGVPIDTVHLPGPRDLAIVLAHGFTLSWQRPDVWRVASRLNQAAGVLSFDFRGHGRSGGMSTLGDREIHDVDVVVRYAREIGYQNVATVGFSMGGSVVLRHAALLDGTSAVVSVSSPGRWYYRGTLPMRRLHWAVERRVGRLITRRFLATRVSPAGWNPVPMPPAQAAALIAPIPLLIVHGEQDHYFPVEHARQLYAAALDPKELWLIPDMAHAESGCSDATADRIARWVRTAALGEPEPGSASAPGQRLTPHS